MSAEIIPLLPCAGECGKLGAPRRTNNHEGKHTLVYLCRECFAAWREAWLSSKGLR